LLITGLAGDARSVVRHAKQVVLNHTVAFDTVPTGYFIAHEVGKYLQEFTVNGRTRPLACHVFIADGFNEKSLYEIDAAGNVAQIWAGVGGKYMESGRDILEDCLNGAAVFSVEEARTIAESILQGNGSKKKMLFLDGEVTEDSENIVVDGTYNTVHFALYDR
jgi:20S proteasome alpha/beta subunit